MGCGDLLMTDDHMEPFPLTTTAECWGCRHITVFQEYYQACADGYKLVPRTKISHYGLSKESIHSDAVAVDEIYAENDKYQWALYEELDLSYYFRDSMYICCERKGNDRKTKKKN
eukprot:114979_1